ncbi:MAG TPA: DinB family protein [Bacteroidia bacterium]|nr:DinB family protein [Bacteroidia bacterium]HNS12994.1 DinB family protein [Bacteroidia bacterium]
MKIALPKVEDLNDYYKSYFKYIAEDDLMEALNNQIQITTDFLASVSDSESAFAYAPGKWQIKEIIGHLCDAERILSYRALRFARKDQTPLAGFEENDYVENSNAKHRSWSSLIDEKKIVSLSSLHFFKNLNAESFDYSGSANDNTVSVRANLFFIITHERHHLQVIKDRYLKR